MMRQANYFHLASIVWWLLFPLSIFGLCACACPTAPVSFILPVLLVPFFTKTQARLIGYSLLLCLNIAIIVYILTNLPELESRTFLGGWMIVLSAAVSFGIFELSWFLDKWRRR